MFVISLHTTKAHVPFVSVHERLAQIVATNILPDKSSAEVSEVSSHKNRVLAILNKLIKSKSSHKLQRGAQ